MPLIYNGNALAEKRAIIDRSGKVETIQPYLPSPELIKAVNLAILLQRPLLLMGEPGCGKSRLAQALAFELYHGRAEPGGTLDYKHYYEEWYIKSTSKAQDGLYTFDSIRRLADAQIAKSKKDRDLLLDKAKYVDKGPIGRAIQRSRNDDHRVVLLIDEIDKADIDFPNDLLNELDRSEFRIPETGKIVRAAAKPIVIITSNAEKELPDAFLRRCLYHYIKPFEKKDLEEIVKSRYFEGGPVNADLIEKATNAFLNIRKEINDNRNSVGKNVSTSEFLDWFEALKHYDGLTNAGTSRSPVVDEMIEAVRALGTTMAVPLQQALLKNQSTLLHFTKRAEEESARKKNDKNHPS